MELSPYNTVYLAAAGLLELMACILALRRGLLRTLPTFPAYLMLLVLRDIGVWWAYYTFGYTSVPSYFVYWVSQGVMLLARGVVIAEICWRSLRPYRGVWGLSWRLLIGVGLLLIANTTLNTLGRPYFLTPFVTTAERGLELAAVGTLVTLLGICRYYGIRMEPTLKMIALGLGLYSLVQVANNVPIQRWLIHSFKSWATIRGASFQAALVIWCWALRKPLPAPRPAPLLLEQQVYDEMAPQVSHRLRQLNAKLEEMLKG